MKWRKNLKSAAQFKRRGLPTQAFSHRPIPDRRNLRAGYLKQGDTGRTRATFLHGCLKFDIKALRADSPFQCSPAPADHVSAGLLVTPGLIQRPVTRAQTTQSGGSFHGYRWSKLQEKADAECYPPPPPTVQRDSGYRHYPLYLAVAAWVSGTPRSKDVWLSTVATGVMRISVRGLSPSQENGLHRRVPADW